MKIGIGSGIDSRVFQDGDTPFVLKEYKPHMKRGVLSDYHGIHNKLAREKYGFDWDKNIAISQKLQGVNKVVLKVLDLGNDIFEEDGKIWSRVPLIQGDTVYDASNNFLFERRIRDYMQSQRLSFTGGDGANLGYDIWKDKMLISGDDLQIDFINMKIVSHHSGVLKIVITDLGSYIPHFVYCYNAQLNSLVSVS